MTVLYESFADPPDMGLILTPFRIDRCVNARERWDDGFVPRHEPGPAGRIFVNPEQPKAALEQIFAAYNRGSGREVEFDGPSLSVEDLVHLGETTWRCAPFGWEVHR